VERGGFFFFFKEKLKKFPPTSSSWLTVNAQKLSSQIQSIANFRLV